MSLMRSSAFFRAKAKWYRAMAGREAGDAKEKLLATARDFDEKARDSETQAAASAAASAERLKTSRLARRR
jgi:hypothetical protein